MLKLLFTALYLSSCLLYFVGTLRLIVKYLKMMKLDFGLIVAFNALILLFACSKSEDTEPIDVVSETGQEKYAVTFMGNWTKDNHGVYPSDAHFTTLVGMMHSKDTELFSSGNKATKGLENVAEMGQISDFQIEIREEFVDKDKGELLTIYIPTGGTAVKSFDLSVNKQTPLISLVSMLAPTPDWFISFKGSALNEDGTAWKDEFTIDAIVYDAGTEEGEELKLNNAATEPQENISRLNITTPFKIANGVTTPWLARLKFVRVKDK